MNDLLEVKISGESYRYYKRIEQTVEENKIFMCIGYYPNSIKDCVIYTKDEALLELQKEYKLQLKVGSEKLERQEELFNRIVKDAREKIKKLEEEIKELKNIKESN